MGPPGACAQGRVGRACTTCPVGFYSALEKHHRRRCVFSFSQKEDAKSLKDHCYVESQVKFVKFVAVKR